MTAIQNDHNGSVFKTIAIWLCTIMTGWHQELWVSCLALGQVAGLYRNAVKGLSADSLQQVQLEKADTFPDDRRFALMKQESSSKFDPQDPAWMHKENFLCVFTDPQLMSAYRASYSKKIRLPSDSGRIIAHGIPCDQLLSVGDKNDEATGRFLTLWERCTDEKVLGPLDLSEAEGRQTLADFFSQKTGIPLVCVTADNHQFGNTSSGWKQKRDTRTVHVVHEATVRALEKAIGNSIFLNPTRFRPNIVLQGKSIEPFSEFDWIDKCLQCGPSVRLQVIAKTVRCAGVSIDPLDPDRTVLDIPKLLTKHFPEHGPYLGVYAVVENGGVLSLGDEVYLI